MSKFKDFFKPQRMGFHLLLALVITVVLIVIAIIFLNIYTRHGEEVEMPDFVGEDSGILVQDTTHNDFIVVINDYVFDNTKKEGTVLKQNPQAKEMVKKGRKVYLTVASSEPPMIKMPELRDVSLRQAEIMLKAMGLEIGGVIYKPSPFENAVLEQLYKGRAISAGTNVTVGEKITLVVGKDVGELPVDTQEEYGEYEEYEEDVEHNQ